MRSKQSTTTSQSFINIERRESFAQAPRKDTVSLEVDEQMVNKMSQLIQQSTSSQFDEIQVVSREQVSANDIRYKNYETLQQALHQFIQSKPSDDQLLLEDDYIVERKIEVSKNLQAEIKKIENLIPSGLVPIDYYAFRQKQGKKLVQHFKKIFAGNKQIDDSPEQFLAPFLIIYKSQLEASLKQLLADKYVTNMFNNQILASKEIQLGTERRSTRGGTISPTDEKLILEQKRKEINALDLLVLKIVISVERINYYTMGVIMPRNQNLKLIPFFEQTKDQLYDYQSCLQICSLIKHQIERLEQIERQITPTFSQQLLTRNTVTKSAYFTRTQEDIKEKSLFRENFQSAESIKRCFDIWHEFSEDKTQGQIQSLKVNLHVKIISLSENFERLGFKVTIQLFYFPSKLQCQQTQIVSSSNSWLFTEIQFAETLLKDDLVMVIKVYKLYDIPNKSLKSRQQINPKSSEPMKLANLKAYSIVNLSDRFFEDRAKDGKPMDSLVEIKFFNYDQKYLLDSDYSTILTDLRYNNFDGVLNETITKLLNLKLQLTFMSSINRNQLSLRLDQSLIIRQKYFWDKMVKQSPQKTILNERDPQSLYQKEMEQLNLKELQRQDAMNELKINVVSLQLKDKNLPHSVYRVQVFLIQKNSQVSSTIKFEESFYQTGLPKKKMEESFQTQISTIKKGVVNFRSECFLRVPRISKTKDLHNYKLIFFVYSPVDNDKVHQKITEEMVEQEPERYNFYPFFMAKISLLNKNTGLMVGGSSKDELIKLHKFNASKYIQEQIETEEIIPDAFLTINLLLNSQLYTTNPIIDKIIEPSVTNLQIPEVLNMIDQLANNDLLIYHTKIIFSLLHFYNQTPIDKCSDILKAVIVIFRKFQSQEMLPYRSLIQEYAERWGGDRDSDKKLLAKLTVMLEKIPESIIEFLDRPLDTDVSNQINEIQQKLQHMPALLQLTCRLFSKEFDLQYAFIIQKVNTYFKKWSKKNFLIYRHDLIESQFNIQNQMSSKPAKIIQQLQDDVANLQKNFKAAQTGQQQEDSEEVENELEFGTKSDDEDDFQFVEARPSGAKRDTFHNQSINFQENELQMNQLLKMVQDIKKFQTDFCFSIQQVILNTSRYLHENPEMQPDDLGFSSKIKKIIDIQKNENIFPTQKKEMEKTISEISQPYTNYLKEFPNKAQTRLLNYIARRTELRTTFWKTLQANLNVLINYIDRKFVISLFDDKLLLHRIESVLDRIVEVIIPRFDLTTKTYGAFYKSQQEFISLIAKNENQRLQLRDEFENLVKQASKKNKDLRDQEEKEIEKSAVTKVLMLSDLIASETFILLPNDQISSPLQSQMVVSEFDGSEQIQEILATKISMSVYNHLKLYKNQFKENDMRATIAERVKDTTSSELLYLFLYKMSIFEKKYYASLHNQVKEQNDERQSHFSVLVQGAMQIRDNKTIQVGHYKSTSELDDLNEDILGGLATTLPIQQQQQYIFTAKENEETKSGFSNSQDIKSSSSSKMMTTSIRDLSRPSNFAKQREITPGESMQMGLGAKKEISNFKDRQELLQSSFDSGIEKRLCFFLNEMEDALTKYWELKENSPYLSVQELVKMKQQHISLFSILSLQHLSNLTPNAFKLLYAKRPGCLDRLVKQVRLTTTGLEFGLDEFFFNVKKLQVVEQFCKNVIEVLCESSFKKFVSELSEKYTYKSIVSQVWVLQLTLLAEQAQVLYDYVSMGSVLKGPDPQHKQSILDFQQRLQKHLTTQQYLWNNYKDIDDMILPDNIDYYSGIQSKMIKILQVDLDDIHLDDIDNKKLQSVLRPLAMMFVQIDELTFRTSASLSYKVLSNIERLFKDFVDYSGQQGNMNQQALKNKKKQICDQFCEEYTIATSQLVIKDAHFKGEMKKRVDDIFQIKSLYLHVINYERSANQEGNLLAQLISYYNLMQLLQEKNLSVSFQNNIKVKYKNMIDNINKALYDDYLKDVEKAKKDPDHICQKQASQYKDQMKEVKAFMYVEDYYTYKSALEKQLLQQLDNKQNVQTLGDIIQQAVTLLVPPKDSQKSDEAQNQFFDVALKLLAEKGDLQETNYDFDSVISTLENRILHYKMYDHFQKKEIYCVYYRIKIEAFLPTDMQVQDRFFIYRTPSGYNQEFIKNDLGVLLGNPNLIKSKDCDAKPLQPLTSEIRQKYKILANTKNLSETPEEVNRNCPIKFQSYFRQNFKKQFYVEQCPSLDPAGFDEEYVITIYEVKKTFPTMTMIQEVYRTFERRIPRVKIELWSVQMIIQEIQTVLRKQSEQKSVQQEMEFVLPSQNSSKAKQSKAQTLDDLLQKYVTNDDVGGGFPKMLDLFFNEKQANNFISQKNTELKRAYLEMFKGLENWLTELGKVVEVFSLVGKNPDLTKFAEERLEDRTKILNERRKQYKLQLLQENF